MATPIVCQHPSHGHDSIRIIVLPLPLASLVRSPRPSISTDDDSSNQGTFHIDIF